MRGIDLFLNSADMEYPPAKPCEHYLNIACRTALAHRKEGKDRRLRENAGLYLLLADFLGHTFMQMQYGNGN